MLWYKAWLETRIRFLICLIGITVLSGYNVFRMNHGVTSQVNLAYYYSVLHNSGSQVALMSLVAVNFITLGGLVREKAVGAASFTLALPFSRLHLMAVRIAVSLLETLGVMIIPWVVMYLVGAATGKVHSIPQALFHLVLLAAGGLVYYAIALLASSIVEGEYVAPIVSFGAVFIIAGMFDGPGLRDFNPLYVMMAGTNYDAHTGLLRGALPWRQMVAYAALALSLVVVSVKAIQKREF